MFKFKAKVRIDERKQTHEADGNNFILSMRSLERCLMFKEAAG
jgi:hypothetical protein